MYVRPISTRLLRGMLIPAIRATSRSPLPLLVPRVLADDQDPAVAADDLALLAHRLHRRWYCHGPFRRVCSGGETLAAVEAAATTPRIARTQTSRAAREESL